MLDKDALRKLISTSQTPILSVYLHVDPSYIENQAAKPAWRIWLKNQISRIENEIDPDLARSWSQIKNALHEYLSTYRPGGKTLVIFVQPADLTVHELPIALDNAIHYGEILAVPLMQAIENHKSHLIVLVDKERARFIRAYMGSTNSVDSMTIDLDYDWGEKSLTPALRDGGSVQRGDNRERFEDMIDAHIERFYGDVVDALQSHFKNGDFERVILGGSEQSAYTVRDMLPDQLANHLVDVVSIPVDADTSEVIRRIRDEVYGYETRQQQEFVDTLIDTAKANGAAVMGYDDVRNAFDMQQVEVLVLPEQIGINALNNLTLRAIESNCDIRFLHGEPAAHLDEEPAAMLYYAL